MSPRCWMKLVGFPGDLLSRTTYKKRSPCWAHDRKDPQKQWVTYHCLEVSSLSTCPLLSRALLQRPCTSSIFSKDWESSVMSLEKASYRRTLPIGRISKSLSERKKRWKQHLEVLCSVCSRSKDQRLRMSVQGLRGPTEIKSTSAFAELNVKNLKVRGTAHKNFSIKP